MGFLTELTPSAKRGYIFSKYLFLLPIEQPLHCQVNWYLVKIPNGLARTVNKQICTNLINNDVDRE